MLLSELPWDAPASISRNCFLSGVEHGLPFMGWKKADGTYDIIPYWRFDRSHPADGYRGIDPLMAQCIVLELLKNHNSSK